MKRKLGYYYLSETGSRLIISVTIFSFFINLVYAFPWFSSVLNAYSIVGQVLATIGIPTVPAVVYFVFANKSSKVKKASVILYDSKIDRTNRLGSIKDKTGLYIVTGESGCGKSRLLTSVFMPDGHLIEDCLIKDKDYSLPWIEREFSDKQYIILDQFENALTYLDEDKLKIIDNAVKRDCLVVLSFKKEAYGDVCRVFGDKVKNDISGDAQNVFWLSFNEDEKSELIGEMNKTFDGDTNNYLYAEISKDLMSDKITFIQYTFLMRKVINDQHKKANERYTDSDNRYDVLISNYIKDLLDKYNRSQLAYQILYLLSLDNKGIYISRRADFRNISFESQQAIDETLSYLLANELIRTNRFAGEAGNPNIDRFEISHDYISEMIKMICNENVYEYIRSNIEYYHNNIQLKQTEENSDNSIKEGIDTICENFSRNTIKVIPDEEKKYSFSAIDIALIIMLLAISALNFLLIYCFSSAPGEGDILCLPAQISFINSFTSRREAFSVLAFINVMVGISIYYVYNYYKHFLRVFRYKPLRTVIKDKTGTELVVERSGFKNVITIILLIGCIGCIEAFVFQDYWAIGLGVEILLNGCLCFAMMKRTRNSERKTFSSLGLNMCSSGVVVIGLGVAYRFCVYLSIPIAFSFFLLYAIFMGLCIIKHINRKNILALVGKIVFNNEVYKKKNY